MVSVSSPVPPGTLRLVRRAPNPCSMPGTELLLCEGDPTAGPIKEVLPEEGLALPAGPMSRSGPSFHLRVLHFNDLHGHLVRMTSTGSRPRFSRMVWRLHQLRQRYLDDPHGSMLVLSGGDDLVGSAFDELLGDSPESYECHAGYRLYSFAGVDVGVVGNHDLDMGAELLAHAIRSDARFPLLAANLAGCQHLAGVVFPAALLVVKGIRVGIVGLTTGAALRLFEDQPLDMADPLATLNNLLPALSPHCDVLIVLSHLGYSLESRTAAVVHAGDVELAQGLPYAAVDLIIGGHTHDVLNEQGLSPRNIVNGIPIVQAGALGRFLGEVQIVLRPAAAVANARLNVTADLPVDRPFEREHVLPLVARLAPLFQRSLGAVAEHPDFDTDNLRCDFAVGESALANFIADGLVSRCRAQGLPCDFAMIDASSVRSGLPVTGQLTFGDWLDVMPFADTIHLVQLSGQQLEALLHDNARRTDRPNEPHTERGFLHFSRQIRYTINLAAQRKQACASDIVVAGVPMAKQLSQVFSVACTSFIRQSSAAWEAYCSDTLELMDLGSLPRCETGLFLRDELVVYIRDHGGVTERGGAGRDGRVRFTTEVCHDDRAQARTHLWI